MKKVYIAGGGIAGMSAGICLKKKGIPVTIYEKSSKVGQNRHGDYEGLENWIFNESISSFFSNIGFDYSQIQSSPVNSFMVHSIDKDPLLVYSKKPFFFLVKRGDKKNDFDSQLYQQCKRVGVDFVFNSNAPDSCDIIATGTRRASAYVHGSSFKTSQENQVHLLLGSQFSPKGYAYLIINNGYGTIATAFKKVKNNNNNYLENCKKYFRRLDIFISNEEDFGSRGSFAFSSSRIKLPIQVGEAGGFQDYLFGFGMKMSMISGLVAGLHMCGEISNAKLLLMNINKKKRISFLNRIIYEKLSDDQMYFLAQKFSFSNNPLSILEQAYKWNFRAALIWINSKRKYEIRPN